MKRAYLADGVLTTNADPKDATLALDSATWTYLNGLLGTDYCYLVVGGREVVKVQSVEAPNLALVVRGQENTKREQWPVNSSVMYGLTQSEIDDAVTVVGYSITAEYPMVLSNGVLSYTDLELAAIGGITVGGDDEGGWMIQKITGPAGCYNPLAPATPPDIPLNYYNLRIVTEGYFRATTQGAYREFL